MNLKWTLLIVLLCISFSISAQENSKKHNAAKVWKELDARPTPGWFEDAKFGIFIHWGPYSVPAWSPKGTYSEWYQYWLQSESIFGNGNFTGQEIPEFQRKTYGENSTYYDFGEMFTADLFDAKEWASLFEKSGAKYIVITSKHHDGFCLWPSKEANDRGFPWNSMHVGAKKDLLGSLSEEVKKTDVKMGMYYSLYEWYHPWWINDRERFVDEHFHPQFKDLVERYQPDLLWGDGEWEMTSDSWKTPELISWLYNESSVKDKVVINDRWGQETRHHHGGYFTTEYESNAEFDKAWEECRGMGFSFGYNRNEDIDDYNSAKTMVLMLCDLVSQGGNLLLDIGPDERGRIPVIMQERLLQIGDWLKVNGEAIYGSRKWKNAVQWSEGKRDCKKEGEHYVGGDYILKQTIDPLGPECAVKELFFTYGNGNLYAIAPKWPGEKITINNIITNENTNIVFLDNQEELDWSSKNGNIEIELPPYNPNTIKSDLAFVFRISNIKEYAKKPKLVVVYAGFTEDPGVEIIANHNAKIYYSLDGSVPDENAIPYRGDFKLKETAQLSCSAYEEDKNPSDIESRKIHVYNQVKNLTLLHNPSERYSANGEVSLMDNQYGTTNISEGNWLGFEGTDAEILIDFGEEKQINKIIIGTLQAQKSWVFSPASIEFYVSSDASDYSKIGELHMETKQPNDKTIRIEFEKSFAGEKGRYVKLKIKNVGICPEWHKGAGNKSWLFVDEVIIE
jgi:alpha-L-fucosidase